MVNVKHSLSLKTYWETLSDKQKKKRTKSASAVRWAGVKKSTRSMHAKHMADARWGKSRRLKEDN